MQWPQNLINDGYYRIFFTLVNLELEVTLQSHRSVNAKYINIPTRSLLGIL